MHIIKLNATNSTNTYLRELSLKDSLVDYTVVQSDFQTNGRGQMGTSWSSNPEENLMFSVFKDVSFVNFEQHFFISMTVAIAIVKTLESFGIPKLKIKWPNDILSENKKICGVLIENSVKNNRFKNSIIGIGINVNQKAFDNLPQATSLFNIAGKPFNRDEVLVKCMENIKKYFQILEANNVAEIQKNYALYLFKKNKPATFKDATGFIFTGIIQSVSNSGKLQILVEDAEIKAFDLKEVSLMY
ncbi:MAG: biotin--[acetyl-CoA-carboxylase] ligase [Oceanihabitans sp.]